MGDLTKDNLDKIEKAAVEDYVRQTGDNWNFSESDLSLLRHMNKLYGNAMSAKGLNLLDPVEANMFHYNKMGMRGETDYPRVSRSYVFFTRPELNFSYENINSVPFFKWLYSKRIGKMIMTMLTDPSYFINAPAALNTNNINAKSYQELCAKMAAFMAEQENKVANEVDKKYQEARQAAGASDLGAYPVDPDSPIGNPGFDNEEAAAAAEAEALKNKTKEEIEAEAQAGFDSVNLDELTASAFKTLSDTQEDVQKNYNEWDTYYEAYKQGKIDDKSYTYYASLNGVDVDGAKNGEEIIDSLTSMGILKADSWLGSIDKSRPKSVPFNFTSPFIPLLSNCCTSLEGARDIGMEIHQYEEDKFSANLQVAKGFDSVWSSGEFSTSFEDMIYSPVGLLILVWVLYIHYVSRGFIATTKDHIVERVLDYTCSAYVFVLGSDGRHIERWCKFTGCFPKSFPLASQILHSNTLDPEMLQKLQIIWAYNRFEFMDPQIFMDFNFLSESEWLCKLKRPFWEDLYKRAYNTIVGDNGFTKIGDKNTGADEWKNYVYQTYKRNPNIWETIAPNNVGMSGKVPPALIESDYDNQISNVWGGYPYINDGNELIWVMPKFTSIIAGGKISNEDVNKGEVLRDTVDNSGNLSAPKLVNSDGTTEGANNFGGMDNHGGSDALAAKRRHYAVENAQLHNV